MERSEEIEERLTEEEASQIESGTGRKVEKTDAQGKIYIGFDKNDVKPRAGRKGRMIDDNEERYPSRSEMAGGWAGERRASGPSFRCWSTASAAGDESHCVFLDTKTRPSASCLCRLGVRVGSVASKPLATLDIVEWCNLAGSV